MNAIVDPNGPTLAVVPSNPVPEGARVAYFETPDKIRLRYATFPKGPGAPKGTIRRIGRLWDCAQVLAGSQKAAAAASEARMRLRRVMGAIVQKCREQPRQCVELSSERPMQKYRCPSACRSPRRRSPAPPPARSKPAPCAWHGPGFRPGPPRFDGLVARGEAASLASEPPLEHQDGE